ncbi:hypothetical protein [Tropicimonas sp. S265A]|uniref:hypothetical protein n=1 Tax=Tropicimonas sp. S265A TaxID=3415134 RepID=UPI003C7D7BDD
MCGFVKSLKTAIHKRVAFERTAFEIAHLPLQTALDLDLYAGDARKIAHRAVYGY